MLFSSTLVPLRCLGFFMILLETWKTVPYNTTLGYKTHWFQFEHRVFDLSFAKFWFCSIWTPSVRSHNLSTINMNTTGVQNYRKKCYSKMIVVLEIKLSLPNNTQDDGSKSRMIYERTLELYADRNARIQNVTQSIRFGSNDFRKFEVRIVFSLAFKHPSHSHTLLPCCYVCMGSSCLHMHGHVSRMQC